jgi:hypothetical protein
MRTNKPLSATSLALLLISLSPLSQVARAGDQWRSTSDDPGNIFTSATLTPDAVPDNPEGSDVLFNLDKQVSAAPANQAVTTAADPATVANSDDVRLLDDTPEPQVPLDKWQDYPDGQWWVRTPGSFWLEGMSGHVGLTRSSFSRVVPVDVSFSDLVKYLNLGVGVAIEVGHGPVFVGFQGNYSKFTDDGITGPLGVSSVNVKMQYALLNLYVGYHLFDCPLSKTDPYPSFGMDALAGTDWTYLNLKISPARLASVSRNTDWFDPYIGGRAQLTFTQKFNMQAQLAVGGFSIDNDTFFFCAKILGEYRFTPKWSLTIGYQGLGQDYNNGTLLWKLNQFGPVIGLTGRW